MSAQEADLAVGVRVGGGWFSPDGRIRLVRGDRKVVTNDIEAGPVVDFEAEVTFGSRWSGSLALVIGGFDHNHVESFTEGAVVSSVNSIRYVSVLAGPALELLQSERARVIAGLQLSYNSYGGTFEITGETQVPPTGTGPPNLSQTGWSLRNDFRGGLSLTLEVPFADRAGFFLTGRRIVTDFGADIVDDPEDDGQDVDLDFDPWGLTLGVRLGSLQ